MIKVNCPVVVEGRYDRIRLSSVIDTVFIETGGFRIYKDKELVTALRFLARKTGLVILTDSDAAGFQIRSYLKNVLGKDAKLTHVYIPALAGKEKRKRVSSAEGLLGVEGVSEEVLLRAFAAAGVTCSQARAGEKITLSDLYDAGLTGAANSAAKRRELLTAFELPPRLSTSSMLDMLNLLLTREEFLARYSALSHE